MTMINVVSAVIQSAHKCLNYTLKKAPFIMCHRCLALVAHYKVSFIAPLVEWNCTESFIYTYHPLALNLDNIHTLIRCWPATRSGLKMA